MHVYIAWTQYLAFVLFKYGFPEQNTWININLVILPFLLSEQEF